MANPTTGTNAPYVFTAGVAPTLANWLTYNTCVGAVLAPETVIGASTATSGGSSGPQSIPNVSWTSLFLAASVDTVSDLASNVVTINWGGKYDVSLLAQWAANATGRRDILIKYTSGGVVSWLCPSTLIPNSAGPTTYPDGSTFTKDCQAASQLVQLNAGDTLQVYAYQNSGAALNVTAQLCLTWLSN